MFTTQCSEAKIRTGTTLTTFKTSNPLGPNAFYDYIFPFCHKINLSIAALAEGANGVERAVADLHKETYKYTTMPTILIIHSSIRYSMFIDSF